MSFTYEQSTGNFIHDDSLMWSGYSGRDAGLNNPAMQNVQGIGPAPQGKYTISRARTSTQVGPVAMRLTPDEANEMFGRGDFEIHGDNHAANHSASHGCIILSLATRQRIDELVAGGDDILEVTA